MGGGAGEMLKFVVASLGLPAVRGQGSRGIAVYPLDTPFFSGYLGDLKAHSG